jgi:hypothetical protein
VSDLQDIIASSTVRAYNQGARDERGRILFAIKAGNRKTRRSRFDNRRNRNTNRAEESRTIRKGTQMDIETKLDLLLIELNVYAEMIHQLERDMVAFNESLREK